jgi:glycerophosphoryl diester phosphodiesterase
MTAPVVAAHRGGAGVRPENTIAAFDHAVGLGCGFLELDVHATADGVPVVIHDSTVDRVTDGTGPVSGLTAAAIEELDAGYRWSEDGRSFPFRGHGVRIPRLEEIFERYPRSRISIDIKAPGGVLTAAVADLISRFGREDRTVVGSFSCRTARLFRRLSPGTGAIACPNEVRRAVAVAASGLGGLMPRVPEYLMVPEYWGRVRVVSPKLLAAARGYGKHVFVWTVNDTETALRLAEAGVHGIVTDYPGRIAAAFG